MDANEIKMEALPTLDKDKELTFELNNEQFDFSRVSKEELEAVPGAFVLKNVFTPEECEAIIQNVYSDEEAIKEELQPVLFRKWVDDPEAANRKLGTRFHRKGENFNKLLWERVKQHIPEVKQFHGEERKAEGFTQRVRFIRYDGGQRFPPHTDGPFVISPTSETMLTFVVYLDKCKHSVIPGTPKGEFRGGELYFYETPLASASEEPLKKIAKIYPDCGTAVVFPHKTLHESRPLKNGHKYCIRNDVIYSSSSS